MLSTAAAGAELGRCEGMVVCLSREWPLRGSFAGMGVVHSREIGGLLQILRIFRVALYGFLA